MFEHRLILCAKSCAILFACFSVCSMIPCSTFPVSSACAGEKTQHAGKAIYSKQCASCHGDKGEGVQGVSENPLRGTLSIDQLAMQIEKTMPEGSPEECTGTDAKEVAEYIHKAFYGSKETLESNSSRVELAHLTNRQYLLSISDLLGRNSRVAKEPRKHGLRGVYYASRSFKRDKKVLERIDPVVNFNFGEDTPDEKIKNKQEFSMQWAGSIYAEETGEYEIVVTTENGFRLSLNDHDRSRLLDEWVSSNEVPYDHKATIKLIGGTWYSLRLETFKYKEKTSSISLKWKPPHKSLEVIPAQYLSPDNGERFFITQTPFPPDDKVSGYNRGTSISKEWDAATTNAALEVANYIAKNLDIFARTNEKSKDRIAKIKIALERFAENAFKRPVTEAEKQKYVLQFFEGNTPPTLAVKKSVITILKSPYFLYPFISHQHNARKPDAYLIATQLSYALWDSIPDQKLLTTASKGQLSNPESVLREAKRMLKDPRARQKFREFYQEWLMLNEKESFTRDEKLFPGFNETVISDLRTITGKDGRKYCVE